LIMLLDLLDRKIRSAFSNAALEYDLLTSLHKEIGRELMKKVIDAPAHDSVLDIGMGTGWLTKKIQFYLPESKIVGIDFAEGMLKAAQGEDQDLTMIQANAKQLPFKGESYDLIVSNLSLQWIKSLENCFRSINDCLKPEGRFIATMFAYETFHELFDSLNCACVELNGNVFQVERLRSIKQVQDDLEAAGFNNIELDHERIKVNFCDMFRLIKWINDIGANALGRDMFVGKKLLTAANDHYERHYKDKFGIYATFEVLWVDAKK